MLIMASQLPVLLIIIICSLTFASKSDGSFLLWNSSAGLKDMEMKVGSRPPRCVNKCLPCRPCTATLVISQNHKTKDDYKAKSREESYYLLSWKCKCGDKLFQP